MLPQCKKKIKIMPNCGNLQQSLAWCQGTPVLPGIKRRLYYISKGQIAKWPTLPKDEKGNPTSATYSGNFTLVADAKWKYIDILPDKSQLTSDAQGEAPSQTQLNKLRYYDLTDEIFRLFKEKSWHKYCTEDKKDNVYVYGYIYEECIAEYEDVPQEKYKVKILQRIKDTEQLKSIDNTLYSYFQCRNIMFDGKREFSTLLHQANNTNIDTILKTYRVYLYETPDRKTLCYTVDTEDIYIRHLLGGIQKYNEEYLNTNFKDAVVTRQYDLEKKYTESAKSKYSFINHIKYLFDFVYVPKAESYECKLKEVYEIEKKYPVYDIYYLIDKNWPHMKAELLCRKYNDIYDGYNFEVFGKKYSSRKEYLKRRQKSMYRKKRFYDMGTWDPESEIMNSLMYGDPEVYGF